MKAVFLTVHDATSARKVDFHFWADVLCARGVDVDFVTVGFSPITLLKKGGRSYAPPFNEWVDDGPHLRKFLWCPLFHPFGFGNDILNRLTAPLFRHYSALMPEKLLGGFGKPDFFVVENGAGLLLVPALAKRFPAARFIYSVCDRIETLGYHPVILEAEKKALPYFSLIRVPAQVMVGDYDAALPVSYIPHGLVKDRFDGAAQSPYKTERNVISVGDMLFDAPVIETLADSYPDWTFHLFGKGAHLPNPKTNVISYGERPFDDIIPYIKFADIGLAPYRPAPNADYLSQSSMKMIQYTYCKLPIIAPLFAAAGRAFVCAYDPGDDQSIVSAMAFVVSFDRSSIDNSAVLTWEETTDKMLSPSKSA